MSAFIGWTFLIAIVTILLFAVARLIRFLFGHRQSPKRGVDDAGDIVDAAKVGIGMLAVATFILAPSGLMAIAAGLKLVSVSTIVTVAPGLGLIFGGLAIVGAAARVHSRRRVQKHRKADEA